MRKQDLHPYTAIINKQQKNQAQKARLDALTWLTQKFPKVFDTSVSIQPLKHGIMNDILAYAAEANTHGISKSKLREAMVIFTRRIDYLTCLKAREMRIDLEGNPVCQVTEEEATNAALKIKRYVEKSLINAKKDTIFSSIPMSSTPKIDNMLPIFDMEGTTPRMAPTVLIKNKNNRVYHAETVARLKEKLGLSRNLDPQEI